MDQETRWVMRFNEVKRFIETNRRNPSKHRIEEHLMLNFIKHNRKLMNKDEMKRERIEPFKRLLDLIEENKHLNQYK